MPQKGFHCIVDFVDLPFDRCIDCAATLGRCQFTASILRGMARRAQEHEGGGLSVTALVGCVRRSFLEQRCDYYQRPDHQYWTYRGLVGHVMMELGAGDGEVCERPFQRELSLPTGRTLTVYGQPDVVIPSRRLLLDYKTVDRAPRRPSELHIAQLNAYRWLVAPEYTVDRLGLVYLTMRDVKKVAVPVWPLEQTERYLATRAGLLAHALETDEWPPMTEDSWLCHHCPVASICARGPEYPPEEPDEESV